MKKVLTLLLAGTVCLTLAGCGDAKEKTPAGETPSVTVTESTDPAALTSEKLDRTAWKESFTEADNYGMKSVVTMQSTENGQTMSEVVTFIYKFDGGKVSLNMAMEEDGKLAYEGEAYLEIEGDDVTVWQRSKEDGTWTDWDSEEFTKEMLGLDAKLDFVKDEYANFSYNDAEKGYLATASGLTAMKEQLGAFLEGALSQAGDTEGFDVSKFVVKINGGKPSACIAEMTAKAPAPEARDMLTEDTSDGSEGEGTDGTEGESGDTMPETPAPASAKIKLTQVYFDYGKVKVEKPASIAAPDPKDTAIEIIPR